MKFTRQLFIIVISLGFGLAVSGQEAPYKQHKKSEEDHGESHSSFHRHSIAVFLSHTFISQGIRDNDRDWLVAPSWGLFYNYHLSEKWAIGLHGDLIIEEFVVEDRRGEFEDLERSFPFSTLIVGSYRVSEHWAFALGGGAEWEKNENFAMIRFGAEYGIQVPAFNMEIIFALNYDVLIDAYDSFNIGIGVAKLF